MFGMASTSQGWWSLSTVCVLTCTSMAADSLGHSKMGSMFIFLHLFSLLTCLLTVILPTNLSAHRLLSRCLYPSETLVASSTSTPHPVVIEDEDAVLVVGILQGNDSALLPPNRPTVSPTPYLWHLHLLLLLWILVGFLVGSSLQLVLSNVSYHLHLLKTRLLLLCLSSKLTTWLLLLCLSLWRTLLHLNFFPHYLVRMSFGFFIMRVLS